jgi:hypothetical protein
MQFSIMPVTAIEPGECEAFDGDQGLDKRRRNRMDDDLKEADAALAEWGLMRLNDSPKPLVRTPLDRATYGPHGWATGNAVPTYIAPRVDLAEKVFAMFPPLRQRIVLTVYVWGRGLPKEQQIRYARVTEPEFKKEKRIALQWVCCALLLSRGGSQI